MMNDVVPKARSAYRRTPDRGLEPPTPRGRNRRAPSQQAKLIRAIVKGIVQAKLDNEGWRVRIEAATGDILVERASEPASAQEMALPENLRDLL